MNYAPAETRELHGGVQHIYRFEGGHYSASVIQHHLSYGASNGEWELAVIRPEGSVVYDVIGYLTEEEVQSVLREVDEASNQTEAEVITMLRRILA